MFITRAGNFNFKDGRKLSTKDIRIALCPFKSNQGSLVVSQAVEGGKPSGEPTVEYFKRHSDAVERFAELEAENGGVL